MCFQHTPDGKLTPHPVQTDVINPLRILRNTFAHSGFEEHQLGEKTIEGLELLHKLLEALQFLSHYEFSFVQRIIVEQDEDQKNWYAHDVTLLNGCFSPFDIDTWVSEMNLHKSIVAFLGKERHLILDPFIIYTDHPDKQTPDIFLLRKFTKTESIYVASQFGGTLSTNNSTWAEGRTKQELLKTFFEHMQSLNLTGKTPPIETPTLSKNDTYPLPESLPDDVVKTVDHKSPYKFLVGVTHRHKVP